MPIHVGGKVKTAGPRAQRDDGMDLNTARTGDDVNRSRAVGHIFHMLNHGVGERIGGEERITLDIPCIPMEWFVLQQLIAPHADTGWHKFTTHSEIDQG